MLPAEQPRRSAARAHLKAVPEVDVQDLPTEPVEHQVGRVPEKRQTARVTRAALGNESGLGHWANDSPEVSLPHSQL